MAQIIAYPEVSNIQKDDCLIGTQKDQGTNNVTNPTKNFGIGDLGSFYQDNYPGSPRIISYFQWLDQAPQNYFNLVNGADTNIPFNVNYNIVSNSENNLYPKLETSGASPTADTRFLFDAEIYGWWKITYKVHYFDQTGNVEFNGGVRNRTGGVTTYLKMLFDEKTNAAGPNDTIYTGVTYLEIDATVNEIDFVVNASTNTPFPSATGNAPCEVIMEWKAKN